MALYVCRHCGRAEDRPRIREGSDDDSARVSGWRIGPTPNMRRSVICPACASTDPKYWTRPKPARLAPATGHRLVLPAAGAWITANQRHHWRRTAALVKIWRGRASWEAKRLGVPTLVAARVIAELQFRDRRRRDPANWAPTAKAALDGLVDAGVFADDDATRVVGPDMRLGETAKEPALILHLVPIEPGALL